MCSNSPHKHSKNIEIMAGSFLGNEWEQRRVRNQNRQDEKAGEKKIALERKNLEIQIKEVCAEQRLIKTRYQNMVRRSKNEGKK